MTNNFFSQIKVTAVFLIIIITNIVVLRITVFLSTENKIGKDKVSNALCWMMIIKSSNEINIKKKKKTKGFLVITGWISSCESYWQPFQSK